MDNVIRTNMKAGDPSLLERCRNGEILIVQRFLQDTGLDDLVYPIIDGAVSSVAGEETVARVREAGLGQLHQYVDTSLIPPLIKETDKALQGQLPLILEKILKKGFSCKQPIWVLRNLISRFHIPFDQTQDRSSDLEIFRKTYSEGRATALRPHRDSWNEEPPGSINVWVALAPVRPGNGMSLFPWDRKNSLRYVRERGVTLDQQLTRPVNITLEAGDAILFDADLLHASELNRINSTRVAITCRVSSEPPRRYKKDVVRYCRVDPRIPWSFYLPGNSLSVLFARVFRKIRRCFGETQSTPDYLLDIEVSNAGKIPENIIPEIHATDLEEGRPYPLSSEKMLLKVCNNGIPEYWEMDRRCPHQGADLTAGHVDGMNVHCPWHNLPIRISDGKSPCRSLPGLNSRRCEVEEDIVLPHSLASSSGPRKG